MSILDGVLLIGAYFVGMIAIVLFLRRRVQTKAEFLVANRRASWVLTAFSMAATWVWAPSLFAAAEKAYTQGIAGVFWFVVPNILTLVLFAYFAKTMRDLRPYGWTFSDYIREKYSKRTHNLYLIESFGLQVLSMAVQLLAGAVIFHKITGLPFFATTVALALVPLCYTFTSGIRSSLATDFVKMGFIIATLLIGLPIMFCNAGVESFVSGLRGVSGQFGSLFDKNGIGVALSFGLPTAIGLLSGTFGDQMFWQRTFSVRQKDVKRTMLLAAAIFAVVPISLSIFGFFAAGAGLTISDTQLVNVGAVIAFTPRWFLYLFFVLVLSGLISTVDSILCAVSSVAGHDIQQRILGNEKCLCLIRKNRILYRLFGTDIALARTSMVVVSALAICIANIPGITILYLFLLYGTLRSSVMLPTVFAIKGVQMSERGMFYGILSAMVVGLPIFAYGNLTGSTPLIVAGSLFTIIVSGLLSLIVKDKKEATNKELSVKIDTTEIQRIFGNFREEITGATAEMQGYATATKRACETAVKMAAALARYEQQEKTRYNRLQELSRKRARYIVKNTKRGNK